MEIELQSAIKTYRKIGLYSSISLVVITLLTFSFAIAAIPISGSFCLENCIDYPYVNTLSQFPNDYLWMFAALLLLLNYAIVIVSIHSQARVDKKIFSQISLSFALISATILLVDYFIQLSVIPASLMNAETNGITLITQYNPHGIFIALEELGYVIMSFSFLFIAPVFYKNSILELSIKWIFISSFLLTIAILFLISFKYGILRNDRFEVAIIIVDWLVLIINGILLSVFFKSESY